MVVDNDLFLFKVNCHLSNLLFGWKQLTSLPHLTHLQNLDFIDMIILIVVYLCRVDAVRFILDESHTSVYYLIVFILVNLSCFLSNLLNSFDQTIMISVRIICNDPHSSINFSDLLPVWHFARTIVLNSFKFIRIPISP